MVDGVSKLDQIEFATREDAQAENFRKMLLAMARDVRVILIKLADRLHNMRTLDAMAPAHRKRIARETLDIYAPIANRLGLNALYLELQDLVVQAPVPAALPRSSRKAIKTARGNRREVMNRLLDVDPRRLREGAASPRSSRAARRPSTRSTRRCARSTTRSRRCSTSTACACSSPTCRRATRALGVLHELYKPIPGKFKDYIAIPKANGYQSLHTTLFGPFGTPLEAQMRTHDMHRIAEAGVAAHWLYKAGGELDLAEAQRETHRWLQSLLEIQSESRDSKEFLEHVKVDLFPDEIYVFTPKGKIMALPRGATAVDFAYARAHRHRPPLRRGADQLRAAAAAHRAQERRPRRDPDVAHARARTRRGCRSSRTGKARSRIRHFLKGLQQKESAALGERLLNQALATLKVEPESITLGPLGSARARSTARRRQLEILADIGLGKRLSFVVAQALTRPAGKADDAGAQPTAAGASPRR